ncbi:MAG: tRNA (adenosine(37)-N6)-threonylcarbamoyltransferase complex ATPase subunit type 1 TsaE [Coriobacteriia bacterium]
MSTGPYMRVSSAGDMHRAGVALAGQVEPDDVISLTGDLGAGKTALVKGVAEGLGVSEQVTSPTFNILVEHRGALALYHFDLYRLERAGQLEDIDFYGTLEAGGVSLIEWGERFAGELPPDHLSVEFTIRPDDTRDLALIPHGPRSHVLATAWHDAYAGDDR